uniref:Uncharacterized protein n=1 Tax=Romanomermis culicivorax TaxID=13658 RepID=A0A915I988_ROMCU
MEESGHTPPEPVLEVPPPQEIRVLDTADDIQNRRHEVLSHYDNFKQLAKIKADRLEEARQYQYFKRDAHELELWILEKLQTAQEENYKDPTNLQAKIQKHQAFEAEVQAHSNAIDRLDQLHALWDQLLRKLTEKGVRLQQALKLLQFTRQCDEVIYWIKDREAFVTTEEFGQDLEHVEVLQRKFDEFLKDLSNQQYRITEVNGAADKLISEGHPDIDVVQAKRDELNEAWRRLNELAATRKERLFGAHEIQRFNRDIDETAAWIAEKDSALSLDDFGRDLTTVQALQRKHEGTERDLAALDGKMQSLVQESERLKQLHPDRSEAIGNKQNEIQKFWENLRHKALDRKNGLDSSYAFHRFFVDYRDLMSWMADMKAVISSDEPAKDVAGAESLLERHQEHKGEIDAREDSFKATVDAGQRLLDENVKQSDEVREKLKYAIMVLLTKDLWHCFCSETKALQRKVASQNSSHSKLNTLANEKAALLILWEERRILYEQCMDLQLFYRDTDQAETWMTKQEAFLSNEDLGDSLDSVEALIKKHEDFEKSLAAQEEKIKALDEFATKLIEGQHYAADDVTKRRQRLLERRAALLTKANRRRAMLEDAYRLQQFDRDCDEMISWINEKLKTAQDESYLDPTNIQGKLQKHSNFEQELQANKSRLDDLDSSGQHLVTSQHYAAPNVTLMDVVTCPKGAARSNLGGTVSLIFFQ